MDSFASSPFYFEKQGGTKRIQEYFLVVSKQRHFKKLSRITLKGQRATEKLLLVAKMENLRIKEVIINYRKIESVSMKSCGCIMIFKERKSKNKAYKSYFYYS